MKLWHVILGLHVYKRPREYTQKFFQQKNPRKAYTPYGESLFSILLYTYSRTTYSNH